MNYNNNSTVYTPSTSTATATTNIQQFKGQNFSHWKFRVQLLLQKLKVWDLIDGSREPPGINKEKLTEEEEKELDTWIE